MKVYCASYSDCVHEEITYNANEVFKSMADAIESGKNWIKARIEECKLCPSPYIDEETLREIVEDGRLEINHYDDSADLTYADKDDDSEPYFFVDIIELPLRTERVNYIPFDPSKHVEK